MRRLTLWIGWLAVLGTAPAAAQLTSVPHSGEQSIVVTGRRPKAQAAPRIAMSDWRVAETPHLLVFSKGDPNELARVADHLEKLEFLLSILLNHVETADDTLKLQVTLIGDPADFDHLGLHNVRWQQGPYPNELPNRIYYDPREDGAVMATAHADQCFTLVRDAAVISGRDFWDHGTGSVVNPNDSAAEQTSEAAYVASTEATSTPRAGTSCTENPNEAAVTADGRLYSAFAQHYLLTYFPAAYPRWYLEGFGEIFANMDADKPGVIEYGREPDRYPEIIDKFGHYPVRKVLDGTYLHDPHWFPAFSPYTAWALVHLLFFSNEWKAPLHNYLAAVARGDPSAQAQVALGDINKLQRELSAYRGTSVHFARLTYQPGRFSPPIIRRLKASEDAYVRGRLELGARVTVAEAQGPAREKALNAREHWLDGLRQNASLYPGELVAQQLLAEAECRTGHADNCLHAADRALSVSPNDPVALVWKGEALVQQAVDGPASDRQSRLDEGRSAIIQSNHLDSESVLPLLAYYRSFTLAGEAAPDVAVDGLEKALDEVPAAPTTRLTFGAAVAPSDPVDARRILLPLADGAFDPPEKRDAKEILSSLPVKTVASNEPASH